MKKSSPSKKARTELDNVEEFRVSEGEEEEFERPNNDELTASDADDDFDDRYIHLSKYLILDQKITSF